jgi:hypothetical protein
MVRSKTETCVRDGVVYRVETTWDDETGNSEIHEFAPDGVLVRRCSDASGPTRRDAATGSGSGLCSTPQERS